MRKNEQWNCLSFPHERAKSFYEERGIKRYLNSGFMTGDKLHSCVVLDVVQKLKEALVGEKCDDDQGRATIAMILNEKFVGLDLERKYTVSPLTDNFEFEEGEEKWRVKKKVRDKTSGNFPFFLHSNSWANFVQVFGEVYSLEQKNMEHIWRKTIVLDEKEISFSDTECPLLMKN